MPDDKEVRCECGYVVIAINEAEVIDDIRRHAHQAHGIVFSVEEALLVVLLSQLELSQDSSDIDTRDLRMARGGSP